MSKKKKTIEKDCEPNFDDYHKNNVKKIDEHINDHLSKLHIQLKMR